MIPSRPACSITRTTTARLFFTVDRLHSSAIDACTARSTAPVVIILSGRWPSVGATLRRHPARYGSCRLSAFSVELSDLLRLQGTRHPLVSNEIARVVDGQSQLGVHLIGANPEKRWEWDHGGGWRLGQIAYSTWYDPEATGSCVGRTDQRHRPWPCTSTTAAGPSSAWKAWPTHHNLVMNPEQAELDDNDGEPPHIDETLPILQAWASDGGLTASSPLLAAAVSRSPGPFGQGVEALVEALGLTADGRRVRSE